MKKNAEETQHDDEETGSEHVRNTTAQHVRNTTAQHVCNTTAQHVCNTTAQHVRNTTAQHVRDTTAQHVPDTGKEDATLSHCRLIFVHRPPSCGKTSIARGFAMTLYGSYGSGNGLPLYMKPVNRWWDGYRGQPVASPDDPSVQRFRELEQEVKVWADRYPFIAELKDHSIRTNPEWLVVASNYPLEELTNAARNPTFYHALFRRTDNGRRLFHFTTHCYNPDTVPVDAETRRLYHRRLERFVEIIANSH